jgi:hypothetical protein
LFLNIPIISADNQSCDSGSAYCCTSSGASQSCDLSTTGQCSSNLICCNTGDGVSREDQFNLRIGTNVSNLKGEYLCRQCH